MWLWPGQRLSIPTPAYQSPSFLAGPQTVLIMWPRSEKGPTLVVWSCNCDSSSTNIITTADAKSESEATLWETRLVFQHIYNTARKNKSIFKKVSIFCCLLIMWEQGVVSAVALLQHPAESHNYANLCCYYFPSGRSLRWITLLLWNSGLNNIYEKAAVKLTMAVNFFFKKKQEKEASFSLTAALNELCCSFSGRIQKPAAKTVSFWTFSGSGSGKTNQQLYSSLSAVIQSGRVLQHTNVLVWALPSRKVGTRRPLTSK